MRAVSFLPFLGLAACAPEAAPDAWAASSCDSSAPYLGRARSSSRRDLRLVLRDGAELALSTRAPDGIACVGAVVEVPPGFDTGTPYLDRDQAQLLARAGLLVVTFDPRGRGESGGVDDENGPTGQDDFAEVLRWTSAQSGVDADSIVIWSRSFGGALAGGAIGTFEDLQPRAWIDYESPAMLAIDLPYADAFTSERMFALAEASGDAEAWLLERSPAAHISSMTAPYHRLQGASDHALDTLDAAAEMLNAAASSEHRLLNGKVVTTPLTEDDIHDHAYGGRFDPDGDIATRAVIEASGFSPGASVR
ncbi:hypothetical protein LBMAG42_10710 [Deltaproteobacteria bacterium]|nr:hypothetical protein LBMAG42_10710 [Deltaproteobacteria bacterium]